MTPAGEEPVSGTVSFASSTLPRDTILPQRYSFYFYRFFPNRLPVLLFLHICVIGSWFRIPFDTVKLV